MAKKNFLHFLLFFLSSCGHQPQRDEHKIIEIPGSGQLTTEANHEAMSQIRDKGVQLSEKNSTLGIHELIGLRCDKKDDTGPPIGSALFNDVIWNIFYKDQPCSSSTRHYHVRLILVCSIFDGMGMPVPVRHKDIEWSYEGSNFHGRAKSDQEGYIDLYFRTDTKIKGGSITYTIDNQTKSAHLSEPFHLEGCETKPGPMSSRWAPGPISVKL